MNEMTQDQIAILGTVQEKGGIVLAGNREFFAELKFRDGAWIETSGDTMSGKETSWQVNPERALEAIKAVVRDRLGVYGPDRGEVSSADVLRWLRSNPF